jgi:hypothetical protein
VTEYRQYGHARAAIGGDMAHAKLIGLAAAAVVMGCAGTTNQVVPTGHDTYMVANHGVMGWSSGGAQKAKAFQEANEFCQSKGKEVEAVNEHETEGGFGKIASADIEFRCITPGKAQ